MSKVKKLLRSKVSERQRQDILLDDKSLFYETEAYRTLRTNLMFSLVKTGCKKVVITSAVSKEGKSTVAINLARIMAQANQKVLIIDCDLRKPRLHKFFKTKCIPGMSNYLIGETTLADVTKPTDTQNLDVIYSGTIPPNPAEMLSSEEYKRFLDDVSVNYDYIIIDCAPLMPVTDAQLVSKYVDGVVLVALQDFTTFPMMEECVTKLKFAEAKLVGVVLNGVKYNYLRRYSKYGKYAKYYRYDTYSKGL